MSATRLSARADDDGFHQFARAFPRTLLADAQLLLRDIDLAEDAVQETLLRVFRRWSEARSAPEAYSRVTLANVCRDHWRRLRSRPTEVFGEDLESAIGERADLSSDAWLERRAFEQALASLARPQREVVILRVILEFSVAETAQALGIADGTVKSSTHRALRQLRDQLASTPDGAPV